jgi:predicted permease
MKDVRALLRAPLFLATAVLTLAIGMGLSTGVLAVAYGVLLRPLPYADPGRLVVILIHRADGPTSDIGVPREQVDEWQRRSRAFERIAAHSGGPFTIRGAGEPRSVRGAMVTDGFFDLLGVDAREGSTRRIDAATPVVTLSDTLARQLGDSRGWRESGLTIGPVHFDIAGVMPRRFAFPSDDTELWVGADAVPKVKLFSVEDQRDFHLVARLAPGVTIAQAQDDAARVAEELNAGLTEPRRRFATVRGLEDELHRDARTTIAPFVAGAMLVLLIACANVSGLLVGRASARRREFAVRRALGGGTRQILRVAFAETVVIAACGWALGLWFAHLVIGAFVAFGSRVIPNVASTGLEPAVIAGSAVLAALVALVSGAAPALRAVRSEAGTVLQQTSERTGPKRGPLQGGLVVIQIAMTVVLLVCAGLLMRTVVRIVSAESGFDKQHALVTRLMLSETVRFNVTDRAQFVDRLVRAVRGIPGVVSAGVGSDLPPRGTQLRMTVRIVRDDKSEIFALNVSAVTPGYLESIGAKLVSGRFFEERDRGTAVPPVVVSEAAVRRLFAADRDPIGRTWPVSIPTPAGRVNPIVIGVVRDIKYGGLDQDPGAALFAPWEYVAPSQAYLVVRTHGDPKGAAAAVRRAVQELDPSLPVLALETLEEVVSGSLAERRLRLQLAGTFAGLALLLASVAVWGAVAQGVSDRRRELAIRMALGSTDTGVVRLIVRDGVKLIAGGLVIGTLAAVWSARAVRHLLLGVSPFDPLTFLLGVGLAAALACLACYAPARRAASISPAELLREG